MNTKKQSPQFYVPHHFIFYPVMILLIVWCIISMGKEVENKNLWLGITASLISTTILAFMMRQHYALGNQDRIIRLEMKYRYFAITGKRFEQFENVLSFKQIAALRFASDEELPTLVNQTVNEKLSAQKIKSRITNWIPDNMRL